MQSDVHGHGGQTSVDRLDALEFLVRTVFLVAKVDKLDRALQIVVVPIAARELRADNLGPVPGLVERELGDAGGANLTSFMS